MWETQIPFDLLEEKNWILAPNENSFFFNKKLCYAKFLNIFIKVIFKRIYQQIGNI